MNVSNILEWQTSCGGLRNFLVTKRSNMSNNCSEVVGY